MKTAGQLAVTVSVVVTLIAIFAGGYFYGSRTAAVELANLQGQIHQQSVHAETVLADLMKQRDAKQALLNIKAKQQEETDNAAKNEIARLADELASRPIRVRVVTAGGACSGSAAGEVTTGTETGSGDNAATSGLLPESNSRRLRAAIAEVEMLNVAYGSCKALLVDQMQ